MKSLRSSFSHLEPYGDFGDDFFARYETNLQEQTELILELTERLCYKLDDEGRKLLDELSEVYEDSEANAAEFLISVGVGFARQILKTIVSEEGSAAKAAKAVEIYELMVKASHKEYEQD